MEQVTQVAGAIAILTAYVAAQLGMLDQRSWSYLVLNLVGSSVLAVVAWLDADWGFLLLEGVWAVVTAGSILGRLRGRDAAPPAQA